MSLYLGDNLISGTQIVTDKSERIGQIITSTIPLTDAGLHLLDGALISGSGSYSAFVDYIADLYTDNPNASYFAPSEATFIQPTLSANGTLGGDSFAVSASEEYSTSYQAWQAFDNDISTNWLASIPANVSFPVNLIIYNPTALKCSSISITTRSSYASTFTAGAVYGSNDNSTWTTLNDSFTNSSTDINSQYTIDLSSNTNFYKYYKIEFTEGRNDSSTPNASYGLAEVKLNATYQISSEQWWQDQVTTYGVCGKFVYDSVNNTVRLPKVTGFVEGTIDVTALGDLVEAGLPNITGTYDKTAGNVFLLNAQTSEITKSGAFYTSSSRSDKYSSATGSGDVVRGLGFDASLSNSIYGNSTTVQPQTIKTLYYIVIATSTKTDIQVDIDEIATDLNGKADVDLSNCTKPHIVETYVNGTSWYRVYSDKWCEQGGIKTQSGTSIVIDLLKPYKDTNYFVVAIPNGNSNDTGGFTSFSAPSGASPYTYGRATDKFRLTTYNSSGMIQSWFACGYIN